ncbi:acetaldehyde dehydrogenase (acetylating) [Brevibacillus sp. SYP-B805]|uniref:acetaldehyde dehydrogenase (acetylating) n=1 Tax=Brevibacillus sp. SYP-B805 TaxID=1578199 RepID=UPI0013E9CF2E|nr:acetaldehyde dehydrogenase (acetylating) [Brevibacillus sp. SYP-B805]NGQ96924.1 acetaldehyde dehydrogenase (acetylating) [Brevibacillus sp. SYP-B805]
MKLDQDLQSIQEVRNFLHEAKQAQKQLEKMSQAQIDAIVHSMAKAAEAEAARLAEMAVEETGFGKVEDKRIKNLFAAQHIYAAIKDMKTVGIIRRDEANRVWEVAQPMGIVAGIVPSTNPTSTTIFKALIAIKSRNAIIFSPHPSAAKCTQEAARIVREAAERAGAPQGLIHCITAPTLAATQELMTHKLTDVILATGGIGMVKAAYSSGKPAFGVGPGNVPVYVHASANLQRAARLIVQSKTFDNGTICASEQAIVADQSIKEILIAELKKQGAYFLNQQEKEKVAAIIMEGQGLNPKIVGRSAQKLAEMAGIRIPAETKVLIAEEQHIGKEYPFSIEKLSPILAFYTVQNWQEGCDISMKLLELGGLGHTLGIHCEDESVIEAFGLEKPASRIVVNAGTTFGGIGLSTGIFPSLTLGCGSFGNNITSDNIGPQHLLNIKRVAFGIREVGPDEGVREETRVEQASTAGSFPIRREEVLEIIKSVLAEMK